MSDTAIADPPPSGSLRLEDVKGILSPKQIASVAWSTRRKIALWVGAVSAGKTVASLLAFLFALVATPPGELVVIIGKTLQSIEDNVINTLQKPSVFGDLARHTIHTKGSNTATILGRQVMLIGANNARSEERIRGATYALAYVDEATLLPPNFWAMLLTRLRTKGARLLATTNPGSRNHWLRRDYILRADAVDMIVFHLTMADNPSLEPEYVETMQRTYADPILHARFILGLWTQAEGAIYGDFDTRVKPITDHTAHTIPWQQTPDLLDVLAIGSDWGGVNASTAMLLGITAETTTHPDTGAPMARPRLILLDEWGYDSRTERLQLSPAKQVEKFAAWYGGNGVGFHAAHTPNPVPFSAPRLGIFADPSATAWRSSLLDAGFPSSPAANDVMKGIGTLQNLISSHHLLVTDRCVRFLGEVTEYVYDPKKADEGEEYPVTENDHWLDGARYAIYSTRGTWWPVLKRAYGLAA